MSRAHARGGHNSALTEGARQWIPLKVNAAGVMPIIFAQAIMFIPGLLTKVDETNTFLAGFKNVFSWQYNVLFALLIIIFSFFYTAISIPTHQMAEELKRNGGLVPKIKPGKETADYIDDILSKNNFARFDFFSYLCSPSSNSSWYFCTNRQIFTIFWWNIIVDYGECNIGYSTTSKYLSFKSSL